MSELVLSDQDKKYLRIVKELGPFAWGNDIYDKVRDDTLPGAITPIATFLALRRLMRLGLVVMHPEDPLKIRWSLTEKGRKLI